MRTLITFMTGSIFTIALLTRCGVPSADADGPGGSNGSGDGGSSNNGSNVEQTQKSGSRLQARVVETADGARDFIGWYDSKLDIPCSRALAVDGKLRCLPAGSYASQNGNEVFLDSSCLKAGLAVSFESCGSPTYVVKHDYSGASCNEGLTYRANTVRVFEVTSFFEGQLYAKNGDKCTAVSGAKAVEIGAEVPPSTFVEFVAK